MPMKHHRQFQKRVQKHTRLYPDRTRKAIILAVGDCRILFSTKIPGILGSGAYPTNVFLDLTGNFPDMAGTSQRIWEALASRRNLRKHIF
jgi:hypothetical protein